MTALPSETAIDSDSAMDPYGELDDLHLGDGAPDTVPSDAEALGARLGLSPEFIEKIKAEAATLREGITPESIAAFRDRKFAGALSFVHASQRDETQRRDLIAWPQSLFRGEGLWLWGTDETTLVHRILVGNQNCFMVMTGSIPGLYFEAGLAFDDFAALLDNPPADWSCARLTQAPEVPKHQRIRMLTAEVGNTVLLDVEGPITHAVMWGTTVH